MTIADDIFEKLTNEEDSRTCDDISPDACREMPRSFALILVSYFLTKLGDAIASPKTTLAWAATALGTPAFVLGFLVPIRESGSMIPQLFIGGVIRQLPVRKWVWVVGSIGQCVAIVGIGIAVLTLDGAAAGWAMLGLITVFSLARGLSSIAAKDVLGKTIARDKRGQLNGWSASSAGLVTVAIGVVLLLATGPSDIGVSWLGLLLVLAGLLWLIAAGIYANVPEYAGATEGGRSAIESFGKLSLLVTDKPFRRFVITRALLMCSALSAPFYVSLAQSQADGPLSGLAAFIIASGIAGLLSAPVWGRFADASSKKVMIAAALLTSAIGLLTCLIVITDQPVASSVWFLPVAYFVLSIAHYGVRVGRKTYVVNLASGNQRTDYVAISNTIIGVLLLVVGSVGLLTPIITTAGVIGLLAMMGLVGALLGMSLPEKN